jgi:hypothetical protein
MKMKRLLLAGILAVSCLVAGSGNALAGGQHRGAQQGYHQHSIVVYQAQPRVVHKYHTPVYGWVLPRYGYPNRPAYVCSRPVIVEHAPVYPFFRPGWGVSIQFGY